MGLLWPSGGIAEIDHKPEHLSPYEILNEEAALVYTPLTPDCFSNWTVGDTRFRPI